MLGKLLRRQSGFTLLELLIVIVIIGILAAIIVPGLASGPKRARDATRKADLRSIKNALETYYTDQTSPTYPLLTSSLSPNYLNPVPTDPKSGSAYTYTPQTASHAATCAATPCASFTLSASLENAQDSAYPTYSVQSVNQ